METQIKKAVKAGNSSAVILPRSWLNKDVRIELIKKTKKIILSEVINILNNYIDSGEIIGIYLTGSYARNEEDESSDIDILVITKDIDKEMVSEGIYNILIVSKELLKQKLDNDLFPVGQMIKESKPLINSDYIDSIGLSVTEKNVKWYLDTTEGKLEIIRKIIDKTKTEDKNHLSDKIAYTLVLRIKTLYIIKNLIKNRDYLKKDFIRIIRDVSRGNNAYERYLSVKNNKEDKNLLSLEETKHLYEHLRNELTKVKELIKNI